jgi:hypothetical protein
LESFGSFGGLGSFGGFGSFGSVGRFRSFDCFASGCFVSVFFVVFFAISTRTVHSFFAVQR